MEKMGRKSRVVYPFIMRHNSRSKFWERLHFAMGQKIQFENGFTDLSLEIKHEESHIFFWQKPICTHQIGDQFFLNLDSGDDNATAVSETTTPSSNSTHSDNTTTETTTTITTAAANITGNNDLEPN